jgi:hypothetical protein
MQRFRAVRGMIRTSAMALLLTLCCIPLLAARAVTKLEPLPAGVMLPVSLKQRLDARHVRVGQQVTAQLMQRVPLTDGTYLPSKAKVMGTIVTYEASSLTLRLDRLSLKHEQVPIHVKLLAAGHWLDVEQTERPLDLSDRSLGNPANWTTKQIGGDEVYHSGGGSGPVYDQYSERVGHVDAFGVYAPARTPGAAALAMGPFSTTSRGLYDLPGMEIASPGGSESPIVLQLTSPKWQLHGQTALLLETTAKPE